MGRGRREFPVSTERKAAGLKKDDVPKLKLKWAFGVPNATAMYGQPAIAGGRLFVGSDNAVVYALNAETGCVYWSFQAGAAVRTAISVGPITGQPGARYAVYFGDLNGAVYAVNAETGTLLWKQQADPHPVARITGAPTLYRGRLYVPVTALEESVGSNPKYECCTFQGAVVAYDANTGAQIWRASVISQPLARTTKTSSGTQLWGPAGAGVWSAPTIDERTNSLYVATGDAFTAPAAPESDAIVAFDLDTGRRRWVKQMTPDDAYIYGCGGAKQSETCPPSQGPDFDFGASPILRTLPNGRRVLTAGQKSGVAWGLDPDKEGAVLWEHRIGKGSVTGGIEWGGAADEQVVYYTNNDAFVGPDAGGLAAIRLATGERLWMTKPPLTPCRAAVVVAAVQRWRGMRGRAARGADAYSRRRVFRCDGRGHAGVRRTGRTHHLGVQYSAAVSHYQWCRGQRRRDQRTRARDRRRHPLREFRLRSNWRDSRECASCVRAGVSRRDVRQEDVIRSRRSLRSRSVFHIV